MATRVHMQDQVANRIQELMQDSPSLKWEGILQDIATLGIVALFLFIGLSW